MTCCSGNRGVAAHCSVSRVLAARKRTGGRASAPAKRAAMLRPRKRTGSCVAFAPGIHRFPRLSTPPSLKRSSERPSTTGNQAAAGQTDALRCSATQRTPCSRPSARERARRSRTRSSSPTYCSPKPTRRGHSPRTARFGLNARTRLSGARGRWRGWRTWRTRSRSALGTCSFAARRRARGSAGFSLSLPVNRSGRREHGCILLVRAAGGTDNGTPGVRKEFHENYYAAYVLDPEGNNIEVVCQLLA
jgi:hypothetical protein